MPNGDFHFTQSSTHTIYVMRGGLRPDKLQGYSDPGDSGIATLPDTSDWKFQYASTGGGPTSVYKMADLAGYEAGGRTYGIFYRKRHGDTYSTTPDDKIGVYLMNSKGDDMDGFRLFNVNWKPSSAYSPTSRGAALNHGMGALWSFQNKIIGASYTGLYQLDVSSFDFSDAGSTSVDVYFLTDSVQTATNDGVNCMLEKHPWQPCPKNSDSESPLPQDCKCNAGYTGPNGANGICRACEPGSYKDASGNSSCASCDKGKTSSPKVGGCQMCLRHTKVFLHL